VIDGADTHAAQKARSVAACHEASVGSEAHELQQEIRRSLVRQRAARGARHDLVQLSSASAAPVQYQASDAEAARESVAADATREPGETGTLSVLTGRLVIPKVVTETVGLGREPEKTQLSEQ